MCEPRQRVNIPSLPSESNDTNKNRADVFIVTREYKKKISAALQRFIKLNPAFKELNLKLQSDNINSSIQLLNYLDMEHNMEQIIGAIQPLTSAQKQQIMYHLQLTPTQNQQPQQQQDFTAYDFITNDFITTNNGVPQEDILRHAVYASMHDNLKTEDTETEAEQQQQQQQQPPKSIKKGKKKLKTEGDEEHEKKRGRKTKLIEGKTLEESELFKKFFQSNLSDVFTIYCKGYNTE